MKKLESLNACKFTNFEKSKIGKMNLIVGGVTATTTTHKTGGGCSRDDSYVKVTNDTPPGPL